MGGIGAGQVINFKPPFVHRNNNTVEHPLPPHVTSHLPNQGRVEGGILGRGSFLASPHGARIRSRSPYALLVWAVAAFRSLRSFSLRLAPPCLFPPHVSRTRCFAPLNFLTSSSNLPRGTLTLSAGNQNWFTTHSRTTSLTPKNEHTRTPFSPTASCSKASEKREGVPQLFQPSPTVLLLVTPASVCKATRGGLNRARTAT